MPDTQLAGKSHLCLCLSVPSSTEKPVRSPHSWGQDPHFRNCSSETQGACRGRGVASEMGPAMR